MLTFDQIRNGDRPWSEELDELRGDGYLCRFDRARAAHATEQACDYCGGQMDFRGFELTDSTIRSKLPGGWYPGNGMTSSNDRRIAFRAFLVCTSCDHWIEF